MQLRVAVRLSLPVTAIVAGFGIWTQLAHGKAWTWLVLAVAVVAQLATVALVFTRRHEGWAFVFSAVVVTAVVVLLFGAMYPDLVPSTLDPLVEFDGHQRILERLHLEDHDVGRCHFRAVGGGLPKLDVLGFPSAYFG